MAAAGPGFEPRLLDSESSVLPLDDPAISTDVLPNNPQRVNVISCALLVAPMRYVV